MERRIMHSCGHEQTHSIYGMFAADPGRRAARSARQKYKPCYDASRKVAEEAQATADTAIVAELTFVGLQGTPKQVAWAETIRVERIAAFCRRGHEGTDRLAAVADAKWWIDHRDSPDDGLLARCPIGDAT
ncbi:MAG: hypothetical protein QHC67_18015 [Sphingobium sp.]|uniref:hypothetical protein n=1 Tax=Sphingobium sp. TaxID=1912891 RepID=UPI0029A09FA2|nr:hypothetical protein [Sphingobium sp.]MDX3911676.1 hypothetical protein [Sphingobium sp.]